MKGNKSIYKDPKKGCGRDEEMKILHCYPRGTI